jgi:glyoxylase-like metal-dependent hydrolase (beta-lactamase superfamily II)
MVGNLEICKNVYQIGGSSISHPSDCSFYIVNAGQNELVMIDCGAGESFKQLIENIKSVSLNPENLKALILTHCHIDHIGSASRIKERFGVKIIAHERDADAIEGRVLGPTAAAWYGVKYQPVTIDHIMSQETEMVKFGNIEFYLLHTPGHTPGSISVYCDITGTRVLFGQDIHGPFDASFGSNIDDWKISMEKLLELNADILCEGHYGVFKGKLNVKEYIMSYLSKY